MLILTPLKTPDASRRRKVGEVRVQQAFVGGDAEERGHLSAAVGHD